VETHLSIDPGWSCINASRRGKGGAETHVKVQTWKDAYDSAATRDSAIDRTVTGMAGMYEAVQEQTAWLTAVMTDLQNARKYANFQEEWQGKTDEPWDPDKHPETIKQAAEIIHGCLTDDHIAWAKDTPLYDALPKIEGSFGTLLIEHWCGHVLRTADDAKPFEPGPLTKHIQEKYKLFGHPNDCKVLVLTYLWAMIRGTTPDADVADEVLGLQGYWQREGRNPETGEKSIIM
jgi:hypothetical protein